MEEDGRKEKKRKGKWRERVEGEEATLVQTELKKQQSAAYHFQAQFLWIFCLCFNIFYLNALSSFLNIALTFVALCMSSYLWCTFLQMAYNSCFLLSMCTLSIFKCLCPSSLLLLHFSVSLLYFVMQSLDPSGVLSVSWFQCCCFVFVLLCKILANLYFSS